MTRAQLGSLINIHEALKLNAALKCDPWTAPLRNLTYVECYASDCGGGFAKDAKAKEHEITSVCIPYQSALLPSPTELPSTRSFSPRFQAFHSTHILTIYIWR